MLYYFISATAGLSKISHNPQILVFIKIINKIITWSGFHRSS